jgi:hypothetical protein
VAHAVKNESKDAVLALKLEQETKWRAQGKADHAAGATLDKFPRVGKPYSTAWYNAKEAWRLGWEEANENAN